MILVNLLPEELRPIKRTPLPHILSVAVLLLALAGAGLMFSQSFAKTRALKNEIAQREQELKSLADIVNRYNELGERKLELADKVETIEQILGDRKIWSQHLHRLAQLTPENFWYSGVKETKQTFRENRIKIDPKTQKPAINKKGEPEMEVVSVQRPVLEISGYIINDAEGRANLNELLQATTDDQEFSRHFELFRPSIEDTQFKGFNVRGFSAEFVIQSSVSDQDAAASGETAEP